MGGRMRERAGGGGRERDVNAKKDSEVGTEGGRLEGSRTFKTASHPRRFPQRHSMCA